MSELLPSTPTRINTTNHSDADNNSNRMIIRQRTPSSATKLFPPPLDEKSKQKRSEAVLKLFESELEKNPTFIKLNFQLIDLDDLQYLYQKSAILNPSSGLNNQSSGLGSSCQIMYLDLTGNRLGSAASCNLLAEILAQNTTIQYLNLSMNDMGAEGLNELIKVFYNKEDNLATTTATTTTTTSKPQQRVNRSVEHLDLTGNRIGEEGVRSLMDVIKNNTSLVTLSVRSNRVKSSSGVDSLLELMALAMSGEYSVKDVFV